MFGMGGSAVASMAMGEKNEKRVKNTSAFVTYASLIVGILFALILIFFVKPILYTFGANSQTYEMAKGYTFHVSYGAPFIIWSAASSFIVRAEGASSEAMIGSMIGTVANIVLDPVFISGLGMGAAGAAIATTIGNILASIYYLWYFMKKSKSFSVSPKYFKCGEQVLSRVCSIGFPTAIFSALMSVSTIVLNQILVKYGNAPVAAIGIVFKANMFITFLQMGLANGVQPLMGYNFGAGNQKRFMEVDCFTKKCCLVVGILATALFFFFREPIIHLFINDKDVILWRENAGCIYGFRTVYRNPFCKYELHAVYWRCTSCNDSVGAPTGTSADSLTVSVECSVRIKRSHLRTGTYGLRGDCTVHAYLGKKEEKIKE